MQGEWRSSLPKEVLVEDEALRDGLQNEKRVFSVDEKLALISAIAEAGVRRIQVGSFVHPKWVPQMANTDELFFRLPPREGVTYSALVLNRTGLDRAVEGGRQAFVDLCFGERDAQPEKCEQISRRSACRYKADNRPGARRWHRRPRWNSIGAWLRL